MAQGQRETNMLSLPSLPSLPSPVTLGYSPNLSQLSFLKTRLKSGLSRGHFLQSALHCYRTSTTHCFRFLFSDHTASLFISIF